MSHFPVLRGYKNVSSIVNTYRFLKKWPIYPILPYVSWYSHWSVSFVLRGERHLDILVTYMINLFIVTIFNCTHQHILLPQARNVFIYSKTVGM